MWASVSDLFAKDKADYSLRSVVGYARAGRGIHTEVE